MIPHYRKHRILSLNAREHENNRALDNPLGTPRNDYSYTRPVAPALWEERPVDWAIHHTRLSKLLWWAAAIAFFGLFWLAAWRWF